MAGQAAVRSAQGTAEQGMALILIVDDSPTEVHVMQKALEQHGFSAGDIVEVRVSAPASHLANLMYEDPRTPAQAKFSLEYALAMICPTR